MANPRDLVEDERNMAVTNGLEVTERDLSSIKNQCTAWVNFDGTATPPTIRDSFNVADVVYLTEGQFEIHFTEDMDNANYVMAGMGDDSDVMVISTTARAVDKLTVKTAKSATASPANRIENVVLVLGGKN